MTPGTLIQSALPNTNTTHFTIYDSLVGDRNYDYTKGHVKIPCRELGLVLKTLDLSDKTWIRALFPSGIGWSTADLFTEAPR